MAHTRVKVTWLLTHIVFSGLQVHTAGALTGFHLFFFFFFFFWWD
jgi:hypothetical protein